MLQDSLTRGEQMVANAGEGNAVLDLRRRWQRVMPASVSREIEQLTGRKVIGFMRTTTSTPTSPSRASCSNRCPPAAH